jgi:hypothetical protein
MTSRLLAGALALVLCSPAVAHDWYEPKCCSDQDCAPVAAGDVEGTPLGYRIPASGETIPYDDPRIRSSMDGHMHRCSYAGMPEAQTICLYVPAGS